MKLSLPGAALSLLLTCTAPLVPESQATALSESITVVAKSIYPAGSAETGFINDWIRRNSPDHPPMFSLGTVSVTHTRRGPRGLQQGATSAGSPVPLPPTGVEGETITINNTLPDGGSETWGYTWTNGAWKLVSYSFQGPNETSTPPAD